MIKVTKIVDTYEAIDATTHLRAYDLNRDMACFKLGRLVEKQLTFEFYKKENEKCPHCVNGVVYSQHEDPYVCHCQEENVKSTVVGQERQSSNCCK